MVVPAELRYTKDHEWAKEEGGKVYVGITDYAQKELGDVVFVELPAVGATIKKGESFGTVESVKAVSDIYSPIDGVVAQVNDGLGSAPELVNSSPHKDAWMIIIEPTNKNQLSELMNASQYESYIGELLK